MGPPAYIQTEGITVPALIYILCAVTSIVCAWLLLRNARQSRAKLLFWSGWGFVFLAIGNIFLFLDLAVIRDYDLLIVRNVITLSGIMLLLYGLIWEAE